MKQKLKKITKAMFFCLIIALTSCEKDLYEEATKTDETNFDFKSRIVTLKDIPKVEPIIYSSMQSFKLKTSKNSREINQVIFDEDNIQELTDKDNNINYSFRFDLENSPENIF
jgi:hypothetical protein